MNDELKKRFEQVFHVSFERGREQVRDLISRSIRMGRSAERMGFKQGTHLDAGIFEGVTMEGYTRMDDRDFMKVAFFAMVGAEFPEELGMPKQIEAPKPITTPIVIEVVKCQNCGADAVVDDHDRRFLVCSKACGWRSEAPGMYGKRVIDV